MMAQRFAWSRRGHPEWIVGEGIRTETYTPLADIDSAINGEFSYFYCPFPDDSHTVPIATVIVPETVSIQPKLDWQFATEADGIWTHSLTLGTWRSAVRRAQSLMPDLLQKVVLSRESSWSGGSGIVQRHIANQPSDTFRLLVQTDSQTGWGALTPEPLCTITNTTIHTEAIAGTAPRGYEDALMASSKNRGEQDMVVQWILAQLRAIRLRPEANGPNPFRLPSIVHLRTGIRSDRSGQSVGQIISALFPTPAVAGVPQSTALDVIASLEHPRGWYAGLFGLATPGRTEVMVVIRMASWQSSGVSFRVGAGIVSESDPDLEWGELNQKLAMVVPPEIAPQW